MGIANEQDVERRQHPEMPDDERWSGDGPAKTGKRSRKTVGEPVPQNPRKRSSRLRLNPVILP